MQTNFKLPANCKRMLLLIDETVESLPVQELLAENNIESIIYVKTDKHQSEIINVLPHLPHNQINLLTSFDHKKLQPILDEQIIGTKLFISGSWTMIQHVKEIAIDAGFSEDEIQYEAIGPKEEKVLCVKCYSFNKKQDSNEITCEHCETELEVASHFYSKRLDAYLGYIKIG